MSGAVEERFGAFAAAWERGENPDPAAAIAEAADDERAGARRHDRRLPLGQSTDERPGGGRPRPRRRPDQRATARVARAHPGAPATHEDDPVGARAATRRRARVPRRDRAGRGARPRPRDRRAAGGARAPKGGRGPRSHPRGARSRCSKPAAGWHPPRAPNLPRCSHSGGRRRPPMRLAAPAELAGHPRPKRRDRRSLHRRRWMRSRPPGARSTASPTRTA